MEATYLPKRRVLVGKSVNGGPVYSMGSFDSREQAEEAIERFRAFHLERCPNDRLTFSVED